MSGKIAVITGACGGLGEALVGEAQKLGYRVFRLQRCHGEAADIVAVDFFEGEAALTRVSDTLNQQCPNGIDLLINNAGLALMSPVANLRYGDVTSLFNVNCAVPAMLTALMWPLLVRKQGRILNIGSISSRLTVPMLGIYSATKKALLSITDASRTEGEAFGIQASYIELGNVRTGIHEKARVSASLDGPFGPGVSVFTSMSKAVERNAMSPLVAAEQILRVGERTSLPRLERIGMDARLRFWLTAVVPHRLIERRLQKIVRAARFNAQK